MFWKPTRVSKTTLLLLALVGLASISTVELTLRSVQKKWFREKLEASMLAVEAREVIKTYISENGIDLDTEADPNSSGLIGYQFTLITTDQGNLESKLTTINPNWSAVIIDMFKKAGVKQDDYVAISWTGSMPGVNIAVLSALKILCAKPVIISSVGASMWGANNPDFAWLDMENILVKNNIFSSRSVAASIGGRGDRGSNISEKGRELCKDIIKRNEIMLIEEKTLEESIKRRYEIYKSKLPAGKKYSCYINVGGGLSSIGSSQNLSVLKRGLIKKFPELNYPIRGTMILFGEDNIPIINLSGIKKLSEQYGLPIAPEPIPDPPSGGIYYRDKYRTSIVVFVLFFYCAFVFLFVRFDLRKCISKLRGKLVDKN